MFNTCTQVTQHMIYLEAHIHPRVLSIDLCRLALQTSCWSRKMLKHFFFQILQTPYRQTPPTRISQHLCPFKSVLCLSLWNTYHCPSQTRRAGRKFAEYLLETRKYDLFLTDVQPECSIKVKWTFLNKLLSSFFFFQMCIWPLTVVDPGCASTHN